jgi:hypothetical protein
MTSTGHDQFYWSYTGHIDKKTGHTNKKTGHENRKTGHETKILLISSNAHATYMHFILYAGLTNNLAIKYTHICPVYV